MNLGTYSQFCNRSSYSEVTWNSCSPIIFVKETRLLTPRRKRTAHTLKTMCVALWVFTWKCGPLQEGNGENLKHGNVNGDTRGWVKDWSCVTPVFTIPFTQLTTFQRKHPQCNTFCIQSVCCFRFRVVSTLLFISQIKWWNSSLRWPRNTKSVCWAVNTYWGSDTDVACWGMTVVRTGSFWCTFSLNNQSRFFS